jgi:photosystem II stability/assembly factor-like uncharacterized protein
VTTVAPARPPEADQPVEALIEEARRRRRRRYFRALSAVLVVAAGLIVAVRATGHSGHPSGRGRPGPAHPAKSVANAAHRSGAATPLAAALGSGLTDVSCRATRCLAVGYSDSPLWGEPYGRPSTAAAFVSGDGGTNWSAVALPAGVADLNGIDCPSPSTCIAVGQAASPAGVPTGVVLVTDDGGMTWTKSALPTGTVPLASVSCSSPLICVAVGPPTGVEQTVLINAERNGHATAWPSGAPVSLGSRDGGRSWKTFSLPGLKTGYFNVSCDNAGTCLALGEPAGGVGVTIAASTDFGHTWTSVPDPSASYAQASPFFAGGLRPTAPLSLSASSVYCVTKEQCLLSGEISDFLHVGLVEITYDAGRRWHMVDGWSPSTAAAYGWPGPISCVGMSCVALGEQVGPVGAFIGVSQDGGASWTILGRQFDGRDDSSSPPSLECGSRSSCVVVGVDASDGFFIAHSIGGPSLWSISSGPVLR